MTNDQRAMFIQMYSQYREALLGELRAVFMPLENDEDRIKHNVALGHFLPLFVTEQDGELLLRNVAQALIDTAVQSGDLTHGKESK